VGNTIQDEADKASETLSKKRNTTTYGKRKRSDLLTEGHNSTELDQSNQASDACDPPNVTAQSSLMGVKLVWVHPTKRRQTVASRLLDTARQCFVYGSIVPVDNTAFSQPTEAGFAFASRYCQRDHILAYA